MIHRTFYFGLFALALVGCTDNMDSLTREYRNTTNEAIDALMMVNNERSATVYTIRVFKPLGSRFKSIDDRLDIFYNNKESKKAFIKQVFESDGFHLYLSEIEINRQRLALEMTRLRGVMNQLIKEKRQEMDDAGDKSDVNTQQLWPNLHDLIINGEKIATLRTQLNKPKLFTMISTFPAWKEPTYLEMHEKFLERRKNFIPPEVDLAY